jgi:hypothetical protein
MKTRSLGMLTIAVVVTTAIWALLLIMSQLSAPPANTLHEKIVSLKEAGFVYYFNYFNAAFITLFDVAMFAGLYLYCRNYDPFWASIGVTFVPIYGLGNLIAYLSQIFVIPDLIELYQDPGTAQIAQILLGFSIQDWTGSAIQALNGLSYAVLGIPSIIFAVIMYRREYSLRIGSVLLALSGGLSFLAFIGLAVSSATLANATLLSGFVFLMALVQIGLHFLRQPELT